MVEPPIFPIRASKRIADPSRAFRAIAADALSVIVRRFPDADQGYSCVCPWEGLSGRRDADDQPLSVPVLTAGEFVLAAAAAWWHELGVRSARIAA